MNIEDTVEECALDIFDGRGVQVVIRSALIKQESEFKLQRDELLDALEQWTYNPDCMDIKELVAMSKAVIAKAKGETK